MYFSEIANCQRQHELNCHSCAFGLEIPDGAVEDCRRCYFSQVPAITDDFFVKGVRPYCWFSAVLLFMSYIIGLWFTLRTHAATIWNVEVEEKKALQQASNPNGSISQPLMSSSLTSNKPQNASSGSASNERSAKGTIRDTQLYKRILNQSLKQEGLEIRRASDSKPSISSPPHVVPPKSADAEVVRTDDTSSQNIRVAGLSDEQSDRLVRQVAEMAATAAAVAAQDAAQGSTLRRVSTSRPQRHSVAQPTVPHDDRDNSGAQEASGGGHDAPNWGRTKSAVILLGATVLYAIIAEILVNTVDVVLQNIDIDEKFLGITLFALVPNTTEFLVSLSVLEPCWNLHLLTLFV